MIIKPSGEYCTVCGQPATAVWHGQGAVATCGECALDALPALIADAVPLTSARPGEQAKSHIETISHRYWRALSLRLLRDPPSR